MALVKYILDRGDPVECLDDSRWRAFHLDLDGRVVALDIIRRHVVMTLFEGLDQDPAPGQPPALWVTVTKFQREFLPNYWRAYRNLHDAQVGHGEIVAEILSASAPVRGRA